MQKIWILITFIFIELGLSTSALAQDKIITKDGDVLQGWNVEISEKFVFYCTENKADAAIKRMEKDKVLMVKRQDGSTVNLYKDAQPAAEQTTATTETATSEPIMLKVSDLTEKVRNENEALINSMNAVPSFVPEKDNDLKKKANEVWGIMGVKKNSVFTDGNVKLGIVIGFFKKENKNAPAVFVEGISYYGRHCPKFCVNVNRI